MSDVDNDKEEKLAAAKKKYEELKKKQKKKKSKKPKDEDTTGIDDNEDKVVGDEPDDAKIDSAVKKDEKKEELTPEKEDAVRAEKNETIELDAGPTQSNDESKLNTSTNEIPLTDENVTETTAETPADDENTAGAMVSQELEAPFPEIQSSQQEIIYSAAASAEIERLKTKIVQLENQIKSLTLENNRLKSFDEDTEDLAPLPLSPSENKPRFLPRQRKTSFVEVDLYGEASKISDIRKQMEQWKGWQVDMRGWRTQGIGPVFDI